MRYKFIDKITEINDGFIRGIKSISLNEDIFNDHFENMPMIPAAMMTEASLELARYYFWEKSDYTLTVLPKSFKKFKFYKTAEPGSTIVISNTIEQDGISLEKGCELPIKTIGTVDDNKLFEGLFTVVIFDHLSLHDKDKSEKILKVLYKKTG